MDFYIINGLINVFFMSEVSTIGECKDLEVGLIIFAFL